MPLFAHWKLSVNRCEFVPIHSLKLSVNKVSSEIVPLSHWCDSTHPTALPSRDQLFLQYAGSWGIQKIHPSCNPPDGMRHLCTPQQILPSRSMKRLKLFSSESHSCISTVYLAHSSQDLEFHIFLWSLYPRLHHPTVIFLVWVGGPTEHLPSSFHQSLASRNYL